MVVKDDLPQKKGKKGKENDLQKLFLSELKDMYDGEQHGLNVEATMHDTAKKSDTSARISKMVSKGP